MDIACVQRFKEIYQKDPDGVSFCPYRVCPIGAHSDHNHGIVTGFALDQGIHFAYHAKTTGIIEVYSLQFERRAQWHISSIPSKKTGDWADYLRGATIALERRYPLHYGVTGVINGSLPIGGLSSSAAVTLAFLEALCKVNSIFPTSEELIEMAMETELGYVGVTVGRLDPSCEVLGKKDCLLALDTNDASYQLLPRPSNMKPFDIVIFFSGLKRSLGDSKYNTHVDELRAGVYALEAYAKMDYGKFTDAYARDVSSEIFEEYKDRLPDAWRKRCEHWYGEFKRAEQGIEAWKKGDIEEYGRLCFASGYSSIHNWESGAKETIRMYDIMTKTKGIYGGRFSGAGFKGCCMALVDPDYTASVIEEVSKQYLADFPYLEGKYAPFVCHTADGVAALLQSKENE